MRIIRKMNLEIIFTATMFFLTVRLRRRENGNNDMSNTWLNSPAEQTFTRRQKN